MNSTKFLNRSSSQLASIFKAQFEAEKKKLLFSNSYMNEQFHLQKDDLLDELDLTTVEMETSMRMRLRNREAIFLKKIEESLQRIAEGTFGQCESCEEEIEFKRLQARPTTTMCLSCKEDEERQEHIHIDGHRSKSLGAKLKLA